jgi:hypothetical protein
MGADMALCRDAAVPLQNAFQITSRDCRRAGARKPVSASDPAPERRYVPKGKPPKAAQRQSTSYVQFNGVLGTALTTPQAAHA